MTTGKKDKITIYFCLMLTIVFEMVVAILVSNAIGDSRMPISVLRLIFQLLFLVLILLSNNRIAIYIITFYHIIVGLVFFSKEIETVYLLFGAYHIVIGLMIYFNTEIDLKLKNLLSKS